MWYSHIHIQREPGKVPRKARHTVKISETLVAPESPRPLPTADIFKKSETIWVLYCWPSKQWAARTDRLSFNCNP